MEDRLALAVLPGSVVALRALLRRAPRIDGNDFAWRRRRCGLVAKACDRRAPVLGQDRSIEAALGRYVRPRGLDGPLGRARHVLRPQVFVGDEVVVAHKPRRDLLGPVASPVGLSGRERRYGVLGACSAMRALLLASHLALQAALALGLAGREQQRHIQRRAVQGSASAPALGVCCARWHAMVWSRRRDRPGDAEIDPDLATRGHSLECWLRGVEADVPATGAIECDPTHAVLGRHGSREPESHRAELRDVDLRPLSVELLHRHVAHAESLVEPSLAPGGAPMAPTPPVAHRLVEVSEGLLLHSGGPLTQPRRFAGLCQLTLAKPSRWCRASLDPIEVRLLQGEVPDVAGVGAVAREHDLLLGRRCEAVAVCHLGRLLLILDVTADHIKRRSAHRRAEPRVRPRRREASKRWELLAEQAAGTALEEMDDLRERQTWVDLDQEVHVIGNDLESKHLDPALSTDLANDLLEPCSDGTDQHPTAVLRAPDQVVLGRVRHVGAGAIGDCHQICLVAGCDTAGPSGGARLTPGLKAGACARVSVIFIFCGFLVGGLAWVVY